MKLNNTIANFLARTLAKTLIEQKLLDTNEETLYRIILQVVNRTIEEEKKIEEEAHKLLREHIDLIEKEGVSYQKLFQRIKEKIAKERGFPL